MWSIDTACSSGMVALHQALRALRQGDCDLAVVGTVNILAHARSWIGFAKASMLSPEGQCKSFDATGAVFARAEGGGMLVLKRLEEAERDGDNILGVLIGSGVNSDGRTMGLSLPSMVPDDVFYVEAHGTGTAVGETPSSARRSAACWGRSGARRHSISARSSPVSAISSRRRVSPARLPERPIRLRPSNGPGKSRRGSRSCIPATAHNGSRWAATSWRRRPSSTGRWWRSTISSGLARAGR